MSERKTSCYLLILFIVSEFANSSIRCAAAAAADVLNPMMIIMLLSNIPQRQRRSRGAREDIGIFPIALCGFRCCCCWRAWWWVVGRCPRYSQGNKSKWQIRSVPDTHFTANNKSWVLGGCFTPTIWMRVNRNCPISFQDGEVCEFLRIF